MAKLTTISSSSGNSSSSFSSSSSSSNSSDSSSNSGQDFHYEIEEKIEKQVILECKTDLQKQISQEKSRYFSPSVRLVSSNSTNTLFGRIIIVFCLKDILNNLKSYDINLHDCSQSHTHNIKKFDQFLNQLLLYQCFCIPSESFHTFLKPEKIFLPINKSTQINQMNKKFTQNNRSERCHLNQ
ncbi:unnamed protein product [Paramecium primaurelia]|uniref:Uncharacterized protein n=1 Tax=Paramecium primaurelia TaxID=5886 RepID=A0A8S1KVF0_PARPR|nr:unnamed protein product [Paramecium primaurelia]